MGLFRGDFEGEGVVLEADGSPELEGGGVFYEDIDSEPGLRGPDLIAQETHCLTAESTAPMFAGNEELPQIDSAGFRTVKGIADGLSRVLEDDRLVIGGEPLFHALFEFGNGEAGAMAFVFEQLMVEGGEQEAILR